MLRGDWNALRSGDRVLVHHTVDGSVRLLAGVVLLVTPIDRLNEVAIRVEGIGRSEVIHPQRLRVHHDPVDLDGHCWRCASTSPAPVTPKRRGA